MSITGLENTVKAEVIEMLRELPDDCTLEDIQYQLDVYERVKAGRRDFEEGRTHTHEEAREHLRKWLNPSSGRTQP